LFLCSKIEKFYKRYNDQVSIARIYLLIILHTYYKNAETTKRMLDRFNINIEDDEHLSKLYRQPEKFIEELCNNIYTFCDEKSKIKAMLCNVYFLCIYSKYNTARGLFRRSYIYEYIHVYKDYQLKMLYNRTLAQLGLCAFRFGKYPDSITYLHPLCSTGTHKLKEYLSQAYSKEYEKLLDKEERKRMIPYIMTINIDEVESAYYIASIFLYLPDILLFKLGLSHKPFNIVFKKSLDNYTKQVS
jgi:translation initiation factor 3 subunit C